MSGIQTKGPRGVLFRSRIEAQWAYVFDILGFEWEYEPFDLMGYIPDFVLKYKGVPVLIEIKGDVDIWNTAPHKEKIDTSGWDGKHAILGSTYKYHDEYNTHDRMWINIGKLFDGNTEDECIIRQNLTNKHPKWEIGVQSIMIYYQEIGRNLDIIILMKCGHLQNASQWKGNEKYSKSNYKELLYAKFQNTARKSI